MIDNISQDIYWVTLTIIMTSLLWVPHILYSIFVTLLEANNDMTALAAVAYFFVRALHFIAHVIGVPVMRTLLFLAGVACQIAMATALLNAI